MFTEGIFQTQVHKVGAILKSVGLLLERKELPNYEALTFADVKDKPYDQQWESYLRAECYNFVMRDWSLLQFKRWKEDGADKLSYSFLECPRAVVSYEEFVTEILHEDVNLVRGELNDLYEDYILTAPLKVGVTPIRYDYNVHDYTEGLHPVSHMHFGHESDIRVGTQKILRPVTFLLFVIRNCFPTCWVNCLRRQDLEAWARNLRVNLIDVPRKFVKTKDSFELLLG